MTVKGNINDFNTYGKITRLWRFNWFFLKVNAERDISRGACNLFQYFTTRTANALLFHRRQFGPCSNL